MFCSLSIKLTFLQIQCSHLRRNCQVSVTRSLYGEPKDRLHGRLNSGRVDENSNTEKGFRLVGRF